MDISSVPISSCSKEHQKIYQEWFRFADSDSDGRITGGDAIKFFGMSNLNRQDLKQNSNVDLESLKPPVMEGLDALLSAKKKHMHKSNENEVNGTAVVQQSLSALWFSSKSAKRVLSELLYIKLIVARREEANAADETKPEPQPLLTTLLAINRFMCEIRSFLTDETRKVFKSFDSNSDGKISVKQARQCPHGPSTMSGTPLRSKRCPL
ncbi:hypothetical protein ACFX19_041638 [Malus domestica]